MKTFGLAFLLLCSLTLMQGVSWGKSGGKVAGCMTCHFGLPLEGARLDFNEGIGGICSSCHIDHHGKDQKYAHPVEVVPSMRVPADMPLDVAGKMTCITCHSFHEGHDRPAKKYGFFLRRLQGKTFCYSCHKTRLF